jgi:hypothetical protein
MVDYLAHFESTLAIAHLKVSQVERTELGLAFGDSRAPSRTGGNDRCRRLERRPSPQRQANLAQCPFMAITARHP